jgi:predicted nucleic acid-binding protein
MEPAVLGIVLDSSVLGAAERKKLTTPEAIKKIREATRDVPIVICALTVAELGHGIYRADTPERGRQRRQFLDQLKAQVPAEIIARVGADQAAKGITIPMADLIIGACALELGYSVGTSKLRDFGRIPGLSLIHL